MTSSGTPTEMIAHYVYHQLLPLADVVVVRGDVFADVTLLQNKANISYVIKDGQIAVSR